MSPNSIRPPPLVPNRAAFGREVLKLLVAAMSLDSCAVFAARITELGLASVAGTFTDQGWSTYAEFAFATSFTPGSDDTVFARDVLDKLSTSDPRIRAAGRRLFFEAFTLAAADLKKRVESTADDAPRRIPTAEREERRERVKLRLVGLAVETDENLDVSDRLVDLAIEIYEDNVVRYVGPELCTRRVDELRGLKRDPTWAPDAQGHIVMKVARDTPACELDTQFALGFALKRRSLAFEMGDILQFEKHEALTAKLISAMMLTPLPGYAKVSATQALRADVVAFKVLGSLTRKGIKRNASGERPCDLVFDQVLASAEFLAALAPLPATGGSKRAASPPRLPPTGEAKLSKAEKKRRKKEKEKKGKAANAAVPATGVRSGETQRGPGPRLPAGLVGKCGKTADGRRICFGYNLGTCQGANDGEKCEKGWHLCMESVNGAACGKAHPCSRHS